MTLCRTGYDVIHANNNDSPHENALSFQVDLIDRELIEFPHDGR